MMVSRYLSILAFLPAEHEHSSLFSPPHTSPRFICPAAFSFSLEIKKTELKKKKGNNNNNGRHPPSVFHKNEFYDNVFSWKLGIELVEYNHPFSGINDLLGLFKGNGHQFSTAVQRSISLAYMGFAYIIFQVS
jgi:hypothetical protein